MKPKAKNIKYLSVKNECFGEAYCNTFTQEMNNKSLSLLILILEKCSGKINLYVHANGSYQSSHT